MTEDDKNAETYQLDDLNKKEDDTNEDTPLKPKDNDVEAGDAAVDISETKENEKAVMASGDIEKDDKGSNTLLDNPKVKVILAILGAVLLVLLLLIVAIIVIINRNGWYEDDTYRYIRIIPKPNGPQNLISFRHGHLPFEGKVWPELAEQMQTFVNGYNPDVVLRTRNVSECYPGAQISSESMACFYDIRTIDPECLKDDFGYAIGKPCVFIQFNNITGWTPEFYSDSDFDNIPDIPSDLRFLNRANLVYLDCKGNSPVDQENMGPIEYTPTQGFPIQYFPYTGHPHYMPPFVSIRFKSPAHSIAIGITCKLYAKNLNATDNGEPLPILPFNLLIE